MLNARFPTYSFVIRFLCSDLPDRPPSHSRVALKMPKTHSDIKKDQPQKRP
jgi:hypothetical protein